MVVTNIKRQPVKSTNIKSMGYDEKSRTVEIEFHKGAIWQYSPIMPKAWQEFSNADSKGTYFAQYIRGNNRVTAFKIS